MATQAWGLSNEQMRSNFRLPRVRDPVPAAQPDPPGHSGRPGRPDPVLMEHAKQRSRVLSMAMTTHTSAMTKVCSRESIMRADYRRSRVFTSHREWEHTAARVLTPPSMMDGQARETTAPAVSSM